MFSTVAVVSFLELSTVVASVAALVLISFYLVLRGSRSRQEKNGYYLELDEPRVEGTEHMYSDTGIANIVNNETLADIDQGLADGEPIDSVNVDPIAKPPIFPVATSAPPLPPVEMSCAPEPTAVMPEEIGEPSRIEGVPRYADFTFHDDQDDLVPNGHVLQINKWYCLKVAIREKATGIPVESGERRAILEPKQQQPVTIMVTAEGDGFDVKESVQTLKLPPSGDSVEAACFQVLPTRKSSTKDNLPSIRLRLYYQFNLLEVATVYAEVVDEFDDLSQSNLGIEKPIFLKQERLEREYRNFDDLQPRAMHIDITKKDSRILLNFLFFNSTEQKVKFTAPIYLPNSDLEDALVTIRNIWYDIAMSSTFTEQVNGGQDEFVKNIRKLAEAGKGLWSKLFRLNIDSSIYKIGQWLKENPLQIGSIIQISTDQEAADFIFPWSLIYDKEIPKGKYECPEFDGFWGMRYCIEQQMSGSRKPSDKSVPVQDKLKFAFMLWEQFRNAEEQKKLMQELAQKSSGKLDVLPSILTKKDCRKLLENCDVQILYFYAHGYTRQRQADIGSGKDLDLFRKYYEKLGIEQRKYWEPLYKSLDKKDEFEPDRSWIELTFGKLYLEELYDGIAGKFSSKPLVFLNMCESAQLTPSLSDSFIHFFLNRGARGVIGTECPMTVEFAHPFAEKLLSEILSGEKVGHALLNARRHFMEKKNPLGLAYTLYGSATTCFEPACIERSTNSTVANSPAKPLREAEGAAASQQ